MMIGVNNVNYHVEVRGEGEALVLLHGFTGSGASWADCFVRDLRVVTVDLLGHGQTDAPSDADRYRMEYAARDLIAIFDYLKLGKVYLLGYSMGGRLALYTALHYATHVQTLVLESASPGIENVDERRARVEQDERLAQMIEREGIEKFVDYWENLPLFATQAAEMRGRLREQRLRNRAIGLANSLRGMGTGVQPSLWEDLSRLAIPTLIMAGALDTKFVSIARQMQAQIPQSELAIIPDAGHTTHLEQPEYFHQTLSDFLK